MRFTMNSTIRDLIIIVVSLAILNSVPLPFLGFVLFNLFGVLFTIKFVIETALIIWLITFLPSPLREIACIFFALWFFSTFAIFGSWSWIIMLVVVLFLFVWILGLFG